MKQNYYLLICFFGFFQLPLAQAQNMDTPCATDLLRKQQLQDPVFFEKNEAFEQAVLRVFQQKKTWSANADNVKTIPVVVHIIHDNGAENLSDAQVQQAILWLNQALANQGAFNQGSGADAGIQLCLAQRTPDGKVTNGITRNQSALTEMQLESNDLQVKNINRWKTGDYLNIWLVRSICSSTYGCGVYGYSSYPFAHGSTIDGIVFESAYMTELAKIPGLAHETGHYFGLYHTFEGGCTNNNCLTDGDRICDTPPDKSTAGIPCTAQVSTCTSDAQSGPFTSDQPDMTWNFMDYGILACFHDLTPDQATRMNATLDGERQSLLESYGCLPACPSNANAAFNPSAISIFVGETVNFINASQNAVSYNWSINGVSFGSQVNAAYTFQMPGSYTISLTAQPSNTTLCESSTSSVVILVLCKVTASFNVSNLMPDVNQNITVTNTSQNATQSEWFINGVSQGNVLNTLSFPTEGYYEITLITSNGPCTASATVEINAQGICSEDNKLYQMTYEDEDGGFLVGKDVIILEDGNLLYFFDHNGLGFDDLRLVKMTPAGQQLWAKNLRDTLLSLSTLGGLIATKDGGFAISFYKKNVVLPDEALVAKFSTHGDLLWLRQIKESVVLRDLCTAPNGSITVCGYIQNSFENLSVFAQFDADGALQWLKIYKIDNALGAISISSLADGGFIAILQNGFVCRLAPDGSLLWAKQLLGLNLAKIMELENGDMIACGANNTFEKGVLLRLTANGSILSLKQYSNDNFSFYFTNFSRDMQKGLVLACSASSHKLHLVGLDSLDNLKWTRKYAELGQGDVEGLASFKDLSYVLAGTVSNSVPVSKAFIAKVDRKGRLGACPTETPTVKVTDIITFVTPQTEITEIPPKQVVASSIAIGDWATAPDTLCTFFCTSLVEICANNLDDDEDGLIDCLDADCGCTADKCAPKSGNIWYFGDKAGLDFSTDPPTILNDGQTINTLSTTVSDVNGKLLFYADGFYVYNRFNEKMPNSFDKGDYAVPHPGDPSIYYLLRQNPTSNGYSYHILDLKLENGKGDIVPGNPIPLFQSGWGEIYWPALTKACDPDGYWLTSRALYKNTFWSIHIGINGIDPNPVISTVGQDTSIWGWAKFSPDGQHIAVGSGGKKGVEVFDFDASTGKVSNPVFLPMLVNPTVIPYGLEFSPSGRFIYQSALDFGNPILCPIFQFDLEKPGVPAYLITNTDKPIFDLKLAPNGKIYGTVGGAQSFAFMNVIENPNGKNETCDFKEGGLLFTPPFSANYMPFTLPTDQFLPNIQLSATSPDTICAYENISYEYQIERPKCGIEAIQWSLEGVEGVIFTTGSSAQVIYFKPGAGKLIVTAQTDCGLSSDTLNILVSTPLNQTIDLGPDLIVCQNGVFSFNAGSGFAKYLWSDGSTDSTTTTLFPGTYWVNAWDPCGNLQTDTITVSIAPNSVLDLGPDLPQQCSGFSASYQLPSPFSSWQWSPNEDLNCADCPSVSVSPASSKTWVVYAQTPDACISVDTLNALIRDTLQFSRDTFVCEGQTISVFGTLLPSDTTAQFYFSAQGPGCDTLLTINVLGLENSNTSLTVTICSDAFFEYQGQLLPADTLAVFRLPGSLACDSIVSVKVNSFPELNLSLPIDTSIRIGASVLLNPQWMSAGTPDFSWTPSDGLSCIICPNPIASPLDTTIYTLAITDANGCTAQESIQIRVSEECRIRVPNAFTPNSDQANDLFRPISDPCVRMVRSWRIFNRWGQIVFEQINFPASDPNLGWDGSWNGKAQASDVYVWTAEFEYYDGKIEPQKGEVTLVR